MRFVALGKSMSVLLLDRGPANQVVLADRDEHNASMSERRQLDRVAATGATLATVMTLLYIWLITQTGNGLQVWDFAIRRPPSHAVFLRTHEGIHPWMLILALLLAATALAGYGAWIHSPHRRLALLVAGMILTLFGIRILQFISLIGATIFLAGLLCLVAAVRKRH